MLATISRRLAEVALVAALSTTVAAGLAQQPVATAVANTSPLSTDAVLQEMSSEAGVIFAGQVVAVNRPAGYAGSAEDAAEGFVTIKFRVDEAVLGCTPGSIYTLNEWAGLWTGATERYKPGQRLLMFLRTPDAQGFSSPVHGPEGAVPLRGGGTAPGPYVTTTTAAEWLVDLRWVHAQVLRSTAAQRVTYLRPIRPARSGQPISEAAGRSVHEASGLMPAASGTGEPELLTALPGLLVDETEPLSQVLDLCRRSMRSPYAPQ